MALALAGCSGSGGGRLEPRVGPMVPASDAASCPGGEVARGSSPPAVAGARGGCPYRRVLVIGNAGEGVMRQPEALAVGPDGRVYVADQFSHKVQVFSPAGRFEGQWGSFGSGPGQFGAVGGLAFDARGDLYLADCANDRIEVFTAAGRFIRAWGTSGSAVGQFHLGAGSGPSEPPGGGVAAGARYVYVADTLNNRIERFNLDGGEATVLAPPGSAPGEVMRPKGLAVAIGGPAASETLYVADNGNGRVQALTPDGRFIAQVSTFPAAPPTFQNAYDVAVHGNRVYVVDDNHGRIVELSAGLSYLGTFAGSGAFTFSPFIRAVATGADGKVYVADAHDNDVEAFTPTGVPLHRWGISSNDPGQFIDPVDVATGPGDENLVVEAYAGLIHMRGLTPLERIISWSSGGNVFLGSLWFGPTAADFAPDGSVWVTDPNNGSVRNVEYGGRFLLGVGAPRGVGVPPSAGVLGHAKPSEPGATGGPVRYADLREPLGVAVTPEGDVIVADALAGSVVELSQHGETLAVWRRALAPGFAGAVTFKDPRAVAVGPRGAIYVADSGNHRVVVLGPHGSPLADWGTGGAGPARMRAPAGIAVAASGEVFVTDGSLDRIQAISPDGRLLAVWGLEGSQPGALSDPAGVALDCHGDLLVADSANNRVQVFVGAATASPCRG
ncbi:MAG: NHL repeat-containing protein [Acidobacteriota bacterium]|nr:NHL repeat-containing protein [Acidobacteriota bacterium]